MSSKKMTTYGSFEEWLKDQQDSHRRISSKLRRIVKEVAPQLVESSKWGNGVWLKLDLPIVYIHAERDHVQFGFFAGATFTDPGKILQGKGKFIRHLRIDIISDIDETAFKTMIRKAVKAPPYK